MLWWSLLQKGITWYAQPSKEFAVCSGFQFVQIRATLQIQTLHIKIQCILLPVLVNLDSCCIFFINIYFWPPIEGLGFNHLGEFLAPSTLQSLLPIIPIFRYWKSVDPLAQAQKACVKFKYLQAEHCMFDKKNSDLVGWFFGGGKEWESLKGI